MTEIQIDKVGSVTKNLQIGHKEIVTDKIVAERGAVLAVEVLEDKSTYNVLELPTGRLSKLKKGDIIAVALGQRMGLKGFIGVMPQKVSVGDTIHVLNMGGVAGECISANKKEVGDPMRIKVLGAIARKGKALNIAQATLFAPSATLNTDTPLIVTTGSGMDAGKTTVASQVIKTLTRMGMTLAGAKLTGVGTQRDLYAMQDYGVTETVSFVDAGVPSTALIDHEELVSVGKGALNYLARNKPDAIMIEFGDGLYGKYGVRAILQDKELQKNVRLHVGCARDPVGALKLAEDCASLGLPIDVMSGPVTDNQVGQDFVREDIGVLPYNAFEPNNDIIDLVLKKWADKSELRLSA